MIRSAAPAKVNLFLHVTGRRPDGYHELDSLAVFAGVGDVVTAAAGPALGLTFSGPFGGALSAEPDNLVLRAARALSPAGAAALHLEKNLPIASGIGGGSADAAAALRLARFNSRAAVQDKHYFEGLPSPSAAAVVAALIWLASDTTNIGLPGLLLAFVVTACVGALMISRFPFNSFKQVAPGARVRFPHIVLVPLAFVLIFLYPSITLLVLFGSYALSAPLVWAYRKLRRRTRGTPTPA